MDYDKEKYQRAKSAYSSRSYAEADRLYKELVAENPERPFFRSARALCLYELGRGDEALSEARAAVLQSPKNADGKRVLSLVLTRLGFLEEAKEEAAAAYALNSSPLYAVALAKACIKREEYPEALNVLEDALRLEPTFGPALDQKLRLLRRLDREAEAQETLEAVLAANPESYYGKSVLAYNLYHAKKYRESLPLLAESFRVDSNETTKECAIYALSQSGFRTGLTNFNLKYGRNGVVWQILWVASFLIAANQLRPDSPEAALLFWFGVFCVALNIHAILIFTDWSSRLSRLGLQTKRERLVLHSRIVSMVGSMIFGVGYCFRENWLEIVGGAIFAVGPAYALIDFLARRKALKAAN
jgi:tetratricopeptide (TPR) repeat protein